MPELSLAERVAEYQRARQNNELPSTFWEPTEIKSLEDLLTAKGFTVVPISEYSLAHSYKSSSCVLVMHKWTVKNRIRYEEKVTLFESGSLVASNCNLKELLGIE